MAFGMNGISSGKKALCRTFSGPKETSMKSTNVPKGHFAVYIGQEEKKRYVVPLWYLNEPAFRELLSLAEEEFGYEHSMGGLTIPCSEETFIDLTSRLN